MPEIEQAPGRNRGWQRLNPLRREAWGGHVGAPMDPDGTLLRTVANDVD